MLEFLASVGVVGVLMVVFGFIAIIGLAKLVDEKSKQDDIWQSHCSSCRTQNCLSCECDDKDCCKLERNTNE
jgi:hypothetical protein